VESQLRHVLDGLATTKGDHLPALLA